MTTTTAELRDTLERIEREREGDESFKRLRDFYQDMLRKGLLVKKEYDLPPIDTIGKTAFDTSKP